MATDALYDGGTDAHSRDRSDLVAQGQSEVGAPADTARDSFATGPTGYGATADLLTTQATIMEAVANRSGAAAGRINELRADWSTEAAQHVDAPVTESTAGDYMELFLSDQRALEAMKESADFRKGEAAHFEAAAKGAFEQRVELRKRDFQGLVTQVAEFEKTGDAAGMEDAMRAYLESHSAAS